MEGVPKSQNEMAQEILDDLTDRSGSRDPSTNQINIEIAAADAWKTFSSRQDNLGGSIQKALNKQGFKKTETGKVVKIGGAQTKDFTGSTGTTKDRTSKLKSRADKEAEKTQKQNQNQNNKDDWEDETQFQRLKRRVATGWQVGKDIAKFDVPRR